MTLQTIGEDYRILRPHDVSVLPETAFALDVLEGLSRFPKEIPCAYLYDRKGSELFKSITELDEYYLTACELEILRDNRQAFDYLVSQPFNLVELGIGDGRKTAVLLEYFLNKEFSFELIPVDVSEAAIIDCLQTVRTIPYCSSLKLKGLVADYFDALNWLASSEYRKNVVLFLGSSIGNFDYPAAQHFLRHLWSSLRHGDQVLIGFDLRKDVDVITRAYNDSKGVTREFNLNLLDRMNRELGANFNRDNFTFCCHYDVVSGAVESWLVSRLSQEVHIERLGRNFSFKTCEGIRTERSHKYLEEEISSMAKDTGFIVEQQFFDSRKYFVDSLWRVQKLS